MGPRLAYLVKRFPRLSETFVLNELLELRRQGVDLRLYALMDPREPVVHPQAAAIHGEVTYLYDVRHPWRSWGRLLAFVLGQAAQRPGPVTRVIGALVSDGELSVTGLRHALQALWLAADLRRRGINHLHAHFAHSPTGVARMAWLAGGPAYSFTAHAKDLYTTPTRRLRTRAEDAIFIVTCTHANGRYLESILSEGARRRLHVVHHGTDTRRFSPARRQPEAGRVISVGRLVPKKGYSDLVAALSLLLRRGVAFHWDVFGDGPLRRDLLEQCAQAGLGRQATFHGSRPQDQVLGAYRTASVFALAPVVMNDGDRDGLPNVLVEAMACGVPVVATRISGIPELIEDGIDGVLVDPGEPGALADAIQRLLADHALAGALKVAGRRKVERDFDVTRNTARLAALFTGTAQPLRLDAVLAR